MTYCCVMQPKYLRPESTHVEIITLHNRRKEIVVVVMDIPNCYYYTIICMTGYDEKNNFLYCIPPNQMNRDVTRRFDFEYQLLYEELVHIDIDPHGH